MEVLSFLGLDSSWAPNPHLICVLVGYNVTFLFY